MREKTNHIPERTCPNDISGKCFNCVNCTVKRKVNTQFTFKVITLEIIFYKLFSGSYCDLLCTGNI